eukprot:TRINITY_DN392_c0_g1_i4.p1 TRINITY_DN392_c0_g1~~TRINITY_DN392_c0_g1_i4.p1  ORF type:complete len:230 (-),score=48.13 TRINITY_DN392_c0_g1_i4:73-762(-)
MSRPVTFLSALLVALLAGACHAQVPPAPVPSGPSGPQPPFIERACVRTLHGQDRTDNSRTSLVNLCAVPLVVQVNMRVNNTFKLQKVTIAPWDGLESRTPPNVQRFPDNVHLNVVGVWRHGNGTNATQVAQAASDDPFLLYQSCIFTDQVMVVGGEHGRKEGLAINRCDEPVLVQIFCDLYNVGLEYIVTKIGTWDFNTMPPGEVSSNAFLSPCPLHQDQLGGVFVAGH